MPSTDIEHVATTDAAAPSPPVAGSGRCVNRPDCAKAVANELLDWYPGPGQYCPECGEALVVTDSLAAGPPEAPPAPSVDRSRAEAGDGLANHPPQTGRATDARAARAGAVTLSPPPAPVPPVSRPARPQRRAAFRQRWLWAVAAVCVAGVVIALIAERRMAPDDGGHAVAIGVCAAPSARGFAADLVRGYSAKHGAADDRLVFTDSPTCDVRFSASTAAPQAVVARDGIVAIVNPLNPVTRISEPQLRAIYRGAIRDWSQVGGAPGPIVALMPDDGSDEAKLLGASLLYNVGVDRSVHRAKTSADITRAVTGAGRASRDAIGLVAFSAAVPAKVVPLAYLPAPSVLSISTGRYPYTLDIAVESTTPRADATAAGLVAFARSGDGAAIIAKSGLVSSEGR